MSDRLDRRRGWLRYVGNVLLLLLLTATVVTGGCDFQPMPSPVPCEWMTAPPPDDAGRTAIMVDVSNSTRVAGTGTGAPDYAAAVKDLVRTAVAHRDAVSVGAFSGTGSGLDWSADPMSTDWQKADPNPDNQNDLRDEAVTCVSTQVAAAQTATPKAPGTDVLGALAVAANWLRQTQGSKRLVLATDGLVTTGCANLVAAGFSTDEEIDGIARACLSRQRQEIHPDELSGITVVLVGIGHPAASQPVPTAAQAQWLIRLWQRLCTAAGAQPGACQVDTTPVAGNGDHPRATPAPQVSDPVVTFGDGRQTVYSMPSAALFDTGQWEIRPQAVPLLTDIAVNVRTEDKARVEVDGYADPRGGADDNKWLSQHRAEAVREVLVNNGVANVTARGLGETTSCPDLGIARTAPDGILQCNRRVDIVVTKG
jgi:outer membrane protein OmpA-like peptidoglycan-associated protein